MRLFRRHMNSVKSKICHGDCILFDGSDIQMKYTKMMDGLDDVKDSDKGTIGLGYWLMNVVRFSKDQEMTPQYNKLYSFDHGAKSENKEVLEAMRETGLIIDKNVTKIFDCGIDRPVCRDLIIADEGNFNLRLKKTTKLFYKGHEMAVSKISRIVTLFMKLKHTRIQKSKKHQLVYECGAIKVQYKIKGKVHVLWLVLTKRINGGYCWLLTRSPKESIVEVIKEAFAAYDFRWKIEEYHRHIKECYNLEYIQINKFEGLQSILSKLTIAMSIRYSSLSSLHTRLLLESGVKTLNKERMYELCNFIYYKINTIIKVLLANMTPRAFLPQADPSPNDGQLSLLLNFEN
jgi:hypothetical protein